MTRPVLVTDFDGTVTGQDFYALVRDRLIPPGTPDFWSAYRANRLTHFKVLQRYFEAARPDEQMLRALLDEMEPEPCLAEGVASLAAAGWTVVIVSNGCRWYIDQLLARAGVAVEVHANPGGIENGRLVMRWPYDTSYPSAQTGIDKASLVGALLGEGRTVAFAGNGPTDLAPALLVESRYRFARDELAESLARRKTTFRAFSRWLEVAHGLAGMSASVG
jgi:2-hydroxy-3-keto-5-methylthiopentenyl-1-phosphate phosphatase